MFYIVRELWDALIERRVNRNVENKRRIFTSDVLPCGVCRIKNDAYLTLLDANEEYYRIYGYTREEAEGAGFSTVSFIIYPPDWQRTIETVAAAEKDAGGAFELEVRGIHRGGAILWTLARGIPDKDDPSCFICTVLNVSERRYKMEQLKKHDEERKILLKQSGRCVFRFDIKKRRITIAPETAAQLNMPEIIENVPECFLKNNVLPESKRDYMDFYNAMLHGEKGGEAVIRTVDPRNGSSVWCRCVFSMVTGKKGEPKYAVISIENITEQREKQIAYEKWTQYNKSQLEGAHIYYECNITKNRIDHLGGPLAQDIPDEVRGCYDETFRYILKNLIYPEDLVAYRDFFSRAGLCRRFEEGKCHLELEYRRLGQDKNPFWAKAEVQLLSEPYSGDVKAFFLLKNIDEEKRRELELQELSQKDALTGLLNRRTVIEQISQLFETSTPLGRHAFIMVDIDHFKILNDTKGHRFGDRVLTDFAKSLKESLRAEDIIGRIGGDEFVICLRNVQLNHTLEEKTAQLCTALSRQLDEQTFISASLGVAVFPKDGMTFDELYQKADIALYEAKKLGRSCCVFYQNDMLEENWSPYNDTPHDIENREAPRDFEPEWTLKTPESDKKSRQTRVSLTRRYIKSIQRVFEELAVMDVTGDYFYIPSYREGGVFRREEGKLNEILEENARDTISQEDAARFLEFFHWPTVRRAFADGSASLSSEFRIVNDGESVSWSEFTLVPIQIAQRKEVYLCFVKDVTARKNAAEAQSQRRILLGRQMESECYRTIMEQAGMMVLEYTKETNTYYASAQARQFTFLRNTGSAGNHYFLTREDVHPDDWEKAEKVSKLIHMGRANAQTTVRLKKTDGAYLWCNVALTVLREENGEITRSMITVTDVDKATVDRMELEYRAEYDALTGHYNFSKFKAGAAALLRSRGEKKYALWYCDLRNFKLINDMYGYDFGDQVLRFWANIGSSAMREGEIFARISGDYFVCLRYYETRRELEQCFQEMSGHLYKYGKDQGKKLRLELVSGVYCIEKNEDLLSIEDMIDRANLAQKSVKRLDGSRMAFYSDEMRRQLLHEKEIEAVMVKSLEDGEFKPYFQPMADVQHGCAVFGAEALVRWERPGDGVLTPGEFIPLFEKNGFIVELDRYVFEQVCSYLHGLLESGKSPIKLSVNVSRISALRKDFISRYTEIKERYQIPDGLLELECTETTMVENAELLESVMRKMRIRGFCFSMDDFGSGYSSLNLLKDVTVEVLKLDMMFFRNNKLFELRNQTIISSIVGMAKALNMKIVAEGVETKEQMEVLKRLGCDYIQGYYISRPLPIEEFEKRFLSPAV